MNSAERLLIRIPSLQRQTHDFFRELALDERLISLFIADPMGVLRERLPFVTPTTVQADADAASNRLLFSMLSNKEFVAWVQNYQADLTRAIDWAFAAPHGQAVPSVVDRNKIMQDLADALIRYGDREILIPLLRAPVSTEFSPVSIVVLILVVICVVATLIPLAIGGDSLAASAEEQARSAIAQGLRSLAEGLTSRAIEVRAAGDLLNL